MQNYKMIMVYIDLYQYNYLIFDVNNKLLFVNK